MPDHTNTTSRRSFLGTTALAIAAAPLGAAKAAEPPSDAMTYEVTRTEEEWRERLSEREYRILREFGTERRFTSDYWEKPPEDAGHYACKGCDLPIYESKWKTVRPIGWVFFHHANTDSVLTSIDEWPAAMSNSDGLEEVRHVTEAHCRRCGSHLGHILIVQEDMLHCINGTALSFVAAEA